MGTNFSGNTSFYYDISDVLRYGDEGQNVIFIKADNTVYEGWWYEGCGIYRHTNVIDKRHIARWGPFIITPA